MVDCQRQERYLKAQRMEEGLLTTTTKKVNMNC